MAFAEECNRGKVCLVKRQLKAKRKWEGCIKKIFRNELYCSDYFDLSCGFQN